MVMDDSYGDDCYGDDGDDDEVYGYGVTCHGDDGYGDDVYGYGYGVMAWLCMVMMVKHADYSCPFYLHGSVIFTVFNVYNAPPCTVDTCDELTRKYFTC